jgi:hypothetical protein
MPADRAQVLIQTAALCEMLLETLGRLEVSIASDEFVVELRELCERARTHLAAIQG